LRKRRSGRWHTVYSLISTVIEEIAIAALLLWILPAFGVIVPPWAVAAVMACFAVYCYIMYRVGHPTVLYEGVTEPGSIVGSTGIVETIVQSEVWVRVQGELWKASCTGCRLKEGDEVTVTAIDGLSLTVRKKS
jgi:membrane protein implicated in regulation of membrane protease activity